ncbi:MAG: hypothetical protein RSD99_30075 [Janthinobacterium sp.]
MWSPRFNLTPAPLALAAMLALGTLSAAQAQALPTVKLSIASQPLGQALNELARQANLQLLFTPELVAGKTAPAISATLSRRPSTAAPSSSRRRPRPRARRRPCRKSR